MSASTPSTRHWFQFRLRTLALLVLVAAVGCGCWTYWHGKIRQRRLAREAILKRQAKLSAPENTWIDTGAADEIHSLAWWWRLAGEREAYVVKDISFDLRSYDDGFEEKTDIDDDDLALLASFPELESLKVPRCNISDEGLRHLVSLPNLKSLDLSGNAITDAGLRHLRNVPTLEKLNLDGTQIRGAGLAQLAGCAQLREATLRGVTLEEAQSINRIRSLESLTLDSPTLQSIHLQGMPALRQVSIRLARRQVSVRLDDLPALENAVVQLTSLGQAESLQLTKLPQLNSLHLYIASKSQGTAESILIQDLPQLHKASVNAGDALKRIVPQLAGQRNIAELWLSSGEPTLDDEDAAQLAPLSKLRSLELDQTKITNAGVRSLASLKLLAELSIMSEHMTDQGVRELAALPNLKSLSLTGTHSNVDLGPSFAKLANVEHIGLVNCRFPALTLVDLELSRLKKLTLRDCEVQGVRVDGLTSLTELSLGVAAAESLHIINLPALDRLNISLPQNAEIKTFKMADLPSLSWLSLQCGATGARIPGDTFDHFSEFTKLKSGIIWGLEMPSAAREKLREFKQQTGVGF